VEQCVLHFLRLPIEDPYLDSQIRSAAKAASETNGQLPLRDLPFGEAGNPVMSLVAFLASTISPSIASDAAQGALGVIWNSKIDQEKQDKEAKEKGKENEENGETKEKKKRALEDLSSVALTAINAAASRAKVCWCSY